MHQLSHKPKNELCSWLKHGNGLFVFSKLRLTFKLRLLGCLFSGCELTLLYQVGLFSRMAVVSVHGACCVEASHQ